MTRKGLIRKGEDGRYYPLVTKQEVAFSRIDRSRVRIQQPGRAVKKTEKRREITTIEKLLHEPYVAKLAFRRARKIAQKHGSLAAAYFLVYSLVGARETGFLLLWFSAMFVYCKRKNRILPLFLLPVTPPQLPAPRAKRRNNIQAQPRTLGCDESS